MPVPRTPTNSPIPHCPSPMPSGLSPMPSGLARRNQAISQSAANSQQLIQLQLQLAAAGAAATDDIDTDTGGATAAAGAIRTQHTGLITNIISSPKLDIYANRPQHQMVYYCASHILFFLSIVYMRWMKPELMVRWERQARFPPTVIFYWFDELLPFCIFTFYALVYFRIPATVSKWEFLAMGVSWIKSIITLHENYQIRSRPESRRLGHGIGFPDDKWRNYLVFFLVRFLVFGGLYKMVQAGLRDRWAWKYRHPLPRKVVVMEGVEPEVGVVRLHRVVPGRFQRKAGRGLLGWFGGRMRKERDELETKKGRREWWGDYLRRGWRVSEVEPEGDGTDAGLKVEGEEVELQELAKLDTEPEGSEAVELDTELEGIEIVDSDGEAKVSKEVEVPSTKRVSLHGKKRRQAYWDRIGKKNW